MRFPGFVIGLVAGFWLISSQSGGQTNIVIGQQQIVGDGRVMSEERPMTAVTGISVNGAFELAISVGGAPKLTLTCDANILPIIRTAISEGRLEIYSDRSYSVNHAIKVMVSTPRLTDLSASGSNRIEVRDIDGGELSISMDGSNRMALAGKVSTLTARMDGSNRLSATELIAGSVKIRIAGSGDAVVDAREHLAAEMYGSGSIVVHGNPQDRRSQVDGSGTITFSP